MDNQDDRQDDRAAYKEILGLLEMKGRLSVQELRAQTAYDDQRIRQVLDRIAKEGFAHQVPDSDPMQWSRGGLPGVKAGADEPT